jgi:hypothetical protein
VDDDHRRWRRGSGTVQRVARRVHVGMHDNIDRTNTLKKEKKEKKQ